MRWSDEDLRQLQDRGMAVDEAERQLELFRRGRRPVRLLRPCTVGDGIRRIDPDEMPPLLAFHAEAAGEGRFSKFVPASGAATRMFADLLRFRASSAPAESWPAVEALARDGDASAAALVRFIDGLPRFAFRHDLQRALGREVSGDAARAAYGAVLDALLGPAGLDYAALPKALLKFHGYAEGARTPFEEHLVEAGEYAGSGAVPRRLHFTVSPEHRGRFEALLRAVAPALEARLGCSFEVEYSVQKPSTDTLAVDPERVPFRDEAGRLVFRPGGHGALIENLAEMRADLIYVKNIDNVQPDRRKPTTTLWKKVLGGYLVRVERRAREILAGLDDRAPATEWLERATRFAGSRLQIPLNGRFDHRSPEARRRWLVDRLSRPIRVCGVVPNTGEPGGGPFWVRDEDGTVSLQIVESAQVDTDDPEQRALFAGATHFNPVDLVCSVRDAEGRSFDLARFVDDGQVIVTRKTHAGRDLLALERPGLWNGAMAGWNTLFVEVPLETFSPVKTVLDLLRQEHLAEGPAG